MPAGKKWDEIYSARLSASSLDLSDLTANSFLKSAGSYLPKKGHALDLAAGLGADSNHLAALGFDVDAWDASSVAMTWLENQARQAHRAIRTRVVDLVAEAFEGHRYDVIHVHHFLDRSLCGAIETALHPGGILLFSTFLTPPALSAAQKAASPGPSRPEFRLVPGEVVELFPTLEPVLHLETDQVVDGALPPCHGFLIGRKPSS